MSIDASTLRELCRELTSLTPSRVLKIQQFQRQNLLFQLRTQTGLQRLALSASGEASALYLMQGNVESPARPPAFLQVLRKHLQGSELTAITQVPDERIVQLSFRAYDELGDPQELTLIAELMGRHANLILCRDQLIVDAIKHIDASQSRHREVMPLRPYLAPPERQGVQARELLEQKDLNPADLPAYETAQNVERFLLASVSGASPRLAQEALYRLGISPDDRPQQIEAGAAGKLKEALLLLAELYLAPASGGYVYYLDPEQRQGFCCHGQDLQHLPYRRHFDTLSAAVSHFYSQNYEQALRDSRRQDLHKKLRREQKRWQRKLELHEADEAEGRDFETVRHYVELLQANYPLLKKQAAGQESITVIDYWQDDMPQVSIPLNPKWSPEKAPDAYAKMARRKEEKLRRATELLKLDRAQLAFLAELEGQLPGLETEVDVLAWQEDLDYVQRYWRGAEESASQEEVRPSQKHPDLVGRKRSAKKVKMTAKAKKHRDKPLPPRRYLYAGCRIEVGRNQVQNEALSLHKAPKGAQWFHLKGSPGSHVIVYCEAHELTPELTLAAARLALWFSSLRHGQDEVSGEVDRCTVRHLKKAKGMPPGQLIYQSEESYRLRTKGPESIAGLEILN